VRVSWAKAPPTLRSWLPVVLPLRSKLTTPTAATGAGPVGRISVPVVVKPKVPAAVALVQAARSPVAVRSRKKLMAAKAFAGFMIFS